MPYTRIHMEISYKVLMQWNVIKNASDFILGAIAPDAVHMNADYSLQLKEQSHVWNCGPHWGITTDSDKWKRNVLDFWNRYQEHEKTDFIRGYFVHLLTDWLYDVKIWTPFISMAENSYEEVRKKYAAEANGIEQWLHQKSPYSKEMWKLLGNSQSVTLEGMILAKDIDRFKEDVLIHRYQKDFYEDVTNYSCCKKDVIALFIEECTEMIVENILELEKGNIK